MRSSTESLRAPLLESDAEGDRSDEGDAKFGSRFLTARKGVAASPGGVGASPSASPGSKPYPTHPTIMPTMPHPMQQAFAELRRRTAGNGRQRRQKKKRSRIRGGSADDASQRVSVYCIGESVDCEQLLARLEAGSVQRPSGPWCDVLQDNVVHSSLLLMETEEQHAARYPKQVSSVRWRPCDVEAVEAAVARAAAEEDESLLADVADDRKEAHEHQAAEPERRADQIAEDRAAADAELQRESERRGFELGSLDHQNNSSHALFTSGGEDEYSDAPPEPREARYVERHAFVFELGCVVLWGFDKRDEREIVDGLLSDPAVLEGRTTVAERVEGHDCNTYVLTRGEPLTVKNDVISLTTSDADEKLVLSHGFAQSARLFVWEARVEATIKLVEHIPRRLASTGRIELTEIEVAKMIGRVFVERTEVNLHSDILDTPQMLWEDGRHESSYFIIREHFDVPDRVEILNKRLDILKELLDVLNSQLCNRHASRLEVIVIWLIVAEIVVTLLVFVLDHVIPSRTRF